MTNRATWRSRLVATGGALALSLGVTALAAPSADAVTATVYNHFSRTCDQNRNGCTAWHQTNGAYNGSVGSDCTETDRQWGWAWTTATYYWTTRPGVRC